MIKFKPDIMKWKKRECLSTSGIQKSRQLETFFFP